MYSVGHINGSKYLISKREENNNTTEYTRCTKFLFPLTENVWGWSHVTLMQSTKGGFTLWFATAMIV